MSDYSVIQDWASLSGTPIDGAPLDVEFAAVVTSFDTKTNKSIPLQVNNLVSLSSLGDIQDSGVLTSEVADAVAYHYSTGDVKASLIVSEPTGWLYADGQSVSTSTYAALFAVLGYTHGGSGSSFNVPDLRGRSISGLDNIGGTSADIVVAAAADTMGGVAGTETHTLVKAELPADLATGTTSQDGDHEHYSGYTFDEYQNGGQSAADVYSAEYSSNWYRTSVTGDHTHTFTGDAIGSGSTHDNVSPTLFMNLLIKT